MAANVAARAPPDAAEVDSERRQPLIGVVGPEPQPELGAGRKHAVGLGHAAGHQVVDHDAEIAVGPRHDEFTAAAARRQRRIDPRDDPLRAGLLVSRRAVDLPGQEKPRQRLHLERRLQLARIDVVVFDRVARPLDSHLLQARHRAQKRLLHLGRQRGRDPVGIDRVVVEALGLEKDLVRRAIRESHDLVLDRRAIARTAALDLTRIHRRAGEIRADDLVRRRRRRRDPAADLPAS